MILANWAVAVAVKQFQPGISLSAQGAAESPRMKGRSRVKELDREQLADVNEALGCSDS